ncbi:Vacuolar protein sorting-associated protein 33A [Rhodotorula toruloides]|nr:Vacuolar protein sorting-associated protein 33A [Rhodotorula toruloides]
MFPLTLGIIKPSVAAHQPHVQEIMQTIKRSGLEFYGEHRGRFYFPRLVQHATSGPFVALALCAPDAIQRWRGLIGPTHVYKGQWEKPETLRARYGLSDTRNGFHGSDSPESAAKELSQVFENWDTTWWIDQRNKGVDMQARGPAQPQSAAIDTDLLRLVGSTALQQKLDTIVGPKTLILTPSLAGPLGLVTEVGLLKNNHAVTKMYWLEAGALSQTERNIVYLCRPEPNQHNYHLLVVPRMTALCTTVLSDLGVLGSLEIQEFQLGLIPLEKDVLSLEYEDVWRKIELDGDNAAIFDLAKALMTIQRAFGPIPRLIGKGDSARRLVDLLKRLRREQPASTPSSAPLANGTIDSMIVIDRQVDMVSALCTQLTYEGLVDEVVGIKHSHVDVDPNLLNPAPAASTSTPSQASFGALPPRKRKHLLTATTDPLFAELRDKNFAVVGTILNRTARRLNEDYEKRHQAKTAAELRQFVGQLGGLQNEHQALRLHTSLTEQIMALTGTDEFNVALEVQQNLVAGVDLAAQENSIRVLINQEAPVKTVLRLLCLYSIVSGGIKPKVLEEFKRDILQAYGFDHLPLLISLERLNLLTRPPPSSRSTPKPPFVLSRKPLRLIVDDVDEQNPQDPSYVFSGYAPLSVRLVQCALAGGLGGTGSKIGAALPGVGAGAAGGMAGVAMGPAGLNGWKGVEEVVKALPGATIDEWQNIDDGPKRLAPGELPTTIVCFLGGITFAEVSAIRLLNRQMPSRNLLVVTTDTVTGSSLLTSLMPEHTRNPLIPSA